MSRSRALRYVVLGVIVFVVAAVIFALLLRRSGSEATALVTRGSLEVTIETVGRLQPRTSTAVRAPLDGTVSLVAVQDGDSVKAGDVVAELDQAPYRQAVDQAENAVTDAEAALSALEQSSATPTPEQMAQRLQASRKVDQARQALQDARDKLAQTLVLAPRDGTVVDVPGASGARVAAGTPLVQLADLGDLQLNVDLDEVDLPHVSTGMTARLLLDAYPGNEITGRITQISPVAQTTGGTTTFPLTVDFKMPPDLVLRPGMNANVSIQTAVRQNVLLVPEAAIRTVGKRTFVTVVHGSNHEEREIQVGLRSNGQVEVASGLNDGDRVVVH